MNSVHIFGVRVDKVNLEQAAEMVLGWVREKEKKRKRFVVTPNIEFIMLAQTDLEFKKILNEADLAIPDSARFGWAVDTLASKNPLLRILKLPFSLVKNDHFPQATGIDLLGLLCKKAADLGFTVGLLGGQNMVAEKAAECLRKSYPGLKIVYAESGGRVNETGEMETPTTDYSLREASQLPTTDLLFVAFGQGKQEKWIKHNLKNLPVKVAVGVGGAFDYISGEVPRAPGWMRQIGLEWLFRLLVQPWRIKRQLNLVKFVLKVVFS